MTDTPAGQHEQRTRVMCHLPVRNAPEEKAFALVINYLQAQRKQQVGITGYTVSNPGTFSGYWWSSKRQQWIEDYIVLLIVDYKIPLGNPKHYSLLELLAQFKEVIANAYRAQGSPQDEIWIVKHTIDRIE